MEHFPQLDTERLRLREIMPSDADPIFQYFSNPRMIRYYGMQQFTNVEEAAQLVETFRKGFESGTGIRWGIELKSTGQLIGTCGFHNWSKKYKRAEAGYEVSEPFWRNGFAWEAVRTIIQFGFSELGLNRIGAVIIPGNSASSRMVEKLGFQKEGLLRAYIIQDGSPMDAHMYSLLDGEGK